MAEKERKLFIIALVGVVGSGKTHVAKILARRLGAKRITTDDVRVSLRGRGKSYGQAPAITARLAERALLHGKSVILDFDAINPARREEVNARAEKFGARVLTVEVRTPERLILARLREKRYTPGDLFLDAAEAVRAYFERKKFRTKFRGKHFTQDFTIDNSRSLAPQTAKIVPAIKSSLK